MNPELRTIIDEAYDLFRHSRALKPLDACTLCCITEAQEDALASMSARCIPPELLYAYNTAAKPEQLRIEEFKHFLPRFLELVAEKQFLSYEPELSFSRFDYFQPSDWRKEELDLLQAYANELFCHFLSTYPIEPLTRIDAIIVMLSKSYVDLNPVLEQWNVHPSVPSALHLNDLLHGGWHFTFDDIGIGPSLIDWSNTTRFDVRFKGILEHLIMNPSDLSEQTQQELSATYSALKF